MRMNNLTLTNLRLIDGTGAPARNVVALTIENGRISGIHDTAPQLGSDSAQSIDLEGRTLLPGLINAHLHIMLDAGPDTFASVHNHELPALVLAAAKRGERVLRAGITTARDLGGFKY